MARGRSSPSGWWCPGRASPLAWAGLPYPWPRGRFRPTVDGLVARGLGRCRPGGHAGGACWPTGRFRPGSSDTGQQGGAGYTVRLQARHAVTLADGTCRRVGDCCWTTADPTTVTLQPAAFGAGAEAVTGLPGDRRTELAGGAAAPARAGEPRRARGNRARRREHEAHKRRAPPRAPVETNGWWCSPPRAGSAWRRWRSMASAGRSRHLSGSQGGRDGQHGWQLDRWPELDASRRRWRVRLGIWALGDAGPDRTGAWDSAPTEAPGRCVRPGRGGRRRTDWVAGRGRCALESPVSGD